MALADTDTYYLRGDSWGFDGETLEEALSRLFQWWDTQPSLKVHEVGNLFIRFKVGQVEVSLEVTDARILQETRDRPNALVEYLAKKMGIQKKDAEFLLSEAPSFVQVDSIQDPGNPRAWRVESGLEVDTVFPKSTLGLVKEMVRVQDEFIRRGERRARTKKGRQLVEIALRSGKVMGLDLQEIKKQTNIPISTLRETYSRIQREGKVVKEFATRSPGQRLTPDQVVLVRKELKDKADNAAEVARVLGLSPRTVRDIRARSKRVVPVRPAVTVALRKVHSDAVRKKVLTFVKRGFTPTEAGRKAGVPGRTAREWIQKEREALGKPKPK